MLEVASLPAFTEADPDTMGEGKLDPLGLAALAERLAELIGPAMTARMARPRFLTAVAVCAQVTESLMDDTGVDGTIPELAFEWHFVEGLVRATDLPPEARNNVPGTAKAGLARRNGVRMTGPGYLKTPTVFGFNGVYRPLAQGLGVIGRGGNVDELGYALLRAWEREQGMAGFIARQPGSPGGAMRLNLEKAVAKTLRQEKAAGPHQLSVELARCLRPDKPGRRERDAIWKALVEPAQPVRAELLESLLTVEEGDDERGTLARVRSSSGLSRSLRDAIDSIDAYEQVANLLLTAFDSIRFECSSNGIRPVKPVDLARANDALAEVSNDLPSAVARARRALSKMGPGPEFNVELGRFEENHSPGELIGALLDRHEQVQAGKGGKRPWFERHPDGLIVRLGYELIEPRPEVEPRYRHPYRVDAMLSFIEDLN